MNTPKIKVSGPCQFNPRCASDRGRRGMAVHRFQGRNLCGYHSPYDVTPENEALYGRYTPDPVTVCLRYPVPGHGAYTVRPEALDVMLARYLPASVAQLKERITERSDDQGGGIDYSDLTTITECLIVLAEYDGYGL